MRPSRPHRSKFSPEERLTLTAEEHPPVSLVRMVRSSAQFDSLSDAGTARKLIEALDRHGRQGRFMLTDLREAVPRNDPGWEALMAELRPG